MSEFVSLRMCVSCRTMKKKADLIKMVRTGSEVVVNPSKKTAGRGAYCCINVACAEKAKKEKRLERTFKQKIDQNVYLKLQELISEA